MCGWKLLIKVSISIFSCLFIRAVNDGPIDTYQLKSLDGQFGKMIFFAYNHECRERKYLGGCPIKICCLYTKNFPKLRPIFCLIMTDFGKFLQCDHIIVNCYSLLGFNITLYLDLYRG